MSPKFSPKDCIVFSRILEDVFPELNAQSFTRNPHPALSEAIQRCFNGNQNLKCFPQQTELIIRLHEAIHSRQGTILIGPAAGGKTTILTKLSHALNLLHRESGREPFNNEIRMKIFNPKTNENEIFGGETTETGLWRDGLLSLSLKELESNPQLKFWMVFDGPLDSSWMGKLSTALDDNKTMCFQSSERVKLDESVRFIFEVDDLRQASPSIISRCGVVWVDSWSSEWRSMVELQIETIPDDKLSGELRNYCLQLFEKYLEQCFDLKMQLECSVEQTWSSVISMICAIFVGMVTECNERELNSVEEKTAEACLFKMFVWSVLWSIGGGLVEESQTKFECSLRVLFTDDSRAR